MKLFSVSIGLLLAALGVFYVPVSFSVDGFGLVVNPGGVRTIRAAEPGMVLHFTPEDGRFYPGQIVSAVVYADAVAANALLERTMRRELAKIDSDHLEATSRLMVDLERDRAKLVATAEQLRARKKLTSDTKDALAELQSFTAQSVADIDSLNDERLAQLDRLEDLVTRSGEVSALPAQRLATMLEDIQDQRLSVITSKGTRFSSSKTILDMIKGINDLTYANSIDEAEVAILTGRLDNLTAQIEELIALRATMQAEARAGYLAKALLPQVAVSDGWSVDMRTLQGSRADVERGNALRLLATGQPMAGVSLLIYGAPDSGQVVLRHGTRDVALTLPADPAQMAAVLRAGGLDVARVHMDQKMIGATNMVSVFVELASLPRDQLSVVSLEAQNEMELPILVTAEITLPENFGRQAEGARNEIIGFLENRHAVILKPGQRVRGSINDTRTGAEIVFEARLLERDFSTVDTQELGIRLGNQSLATKIIRRGVLSQVVIGVDEESAQQIQYLPGAVVNLSFPLGRRSLFSFLLARNAAI